ncbi:nucleotide exchange factor GrpE [Halomonas sp.]|uniref:nucleotide exchange factor GrpE n=1 Tax=Halomonas sp. TaxID=1486246 RepID=UPI003563CD47
MAKEPQTQLDEELARREQDADPQADPAALEGELEEGDLEEAVEGADQAADVDLESPEEPPVETEQDPEVLALTARVEELEQTVVDAKDQQLRAAAEAQNVRRRAELDAEKARKFALEKFVKELLPVVDSLEKALEAMQDGASETHREGVSMTLKMQLDVLEKFGVEMVEPHGEPFDPQYHEAMAMVPNPEMEPNSVMEIMQRGYLLNGRLVRPAMVVVSQAAS